MRTYEVGDARQAGLDRFESGDVEGAVALLREAGAVVDLASVLHAVGRTDEALAVLSDAATATATAAGAAAGAADPEPARLRVALAAALGRFDAVPDRGSWPDDVASLLDIADLALGTDHCDHAAAAFARLRGVDADDGHRVYVAYGRFEAFARLGRWRDALEAALEAGKGDRGALATDAMEYAKRRLFGGPTSAASWEDLAARLAAERGIHRRMHQELT